MSLINYVKGHIAYRNPAHIIIEAGGVGYGLLVSLNTFCKIKKSPQLGDFLFRIVLGLLVYLL